MGAVLMASFIPLFAARLPLEPVQILWVNLLDSVFLTMPLIMEKKSMGLLSGPPREHNKKIVDGLFVQRVIIMGGIIAACGFFIFYYFGSAAVNEREIINPLLLTQAQTAAFWAVLMAHFGFVFSARSVDRSAFTFSPFTNKWLWLGVLVSIVARYPGLPAPRFYRPGNRQVHQEKICCPRNCLKFSILNFKFKYH
jgi:magnesium-transporting ATPase (P-type)